MNEIINWDKVKRVNLLNKNFVMASFDIENCDQHTLNKVKSEIRRDYGKWQRIQETPTEINFIFNYLPYKNKN